jgi:hypothetical protein
VDSIKEDSAVAVAVVVASASNAVDNVQHKRPTRKRRPGELAVATDNPPPKDPELTSTQPVNKRYSKRTKAGTNIAQADGIVRMGLGFQKKEIMRVKMK